MIRVAISIAVVLFFYNFIAIGDGDSTQLIDLRYKSYSACVLGIIMLTISYKWWANSIAAIEGFLMIVNLHIAANWHTASIFDAYYSQIQYYACVIELLILCIAVVQAVTDGGRASANDYFNRGKHRDLMHSGRV